MTGLTFILIFSIDIAGYLACYDNLPKNWVRIIPYAWLFYLRKR